MPEVGLELHSNPCKHWEVPETCGIRAAPTNIRPSTKPRVWTLSTLSFCHIPTLNRVSRGLRRCDERLVIGVPKRAEEGPKGGRVVSCPKFAAFSPDSGGQNCSASARFTAVLSRKAESKAHRSRLCRPRMGRVRHGQDRTGRQGIHDLLVSGKTSRVFQRTAGCPPSVGPARNQLEPVKPAVTKVVLGECSARTQRQQLIQQQSSSGLSSGSSHS
jgi:hypothetical protein